jgi:hypothetical protein
MKYKLFLLFISILFSVVSQKMEHKNILDLIQLKKKYSKQDSLIFDSTVLIYFSSIKYNEFDFLEGNIENFAPRFKNLYEASNFGYGILKDSILIAIKIENSNPYEISKLTFCDIKNNKLLFSYHYFDNEKIAVSKYVYGSKDANFYLKEYIQLTTEDVFIQNLKNTKLSHYFNVDFNRMRENIKLTHKTFEKNSPSIYIYLDVFDSD